MESKKQRSLLQELKHTLFEKEFEIKDLGFSSRGGTYSEFYGEEEIYGEQFEDKGEDLRIPIGEPDEIAESPSAEEPDAFLSSGTQTPEAKPAWTSPLNKLEPTKVKQKTVGTFQAYFKEEPGNIFFPDGNLKFSGNSQKNALLIWGEDKKGFSLNPFKSDASRKRKGLKHIIEEKAWEEERLYTDIVICVHTDDFENIRISSDKRSARRYDEGSEEIGYLKYLANKEFLSDESAQGLTLIPDRGFHFEFRPFRFEPLRGKFMAVLKENTFIVEPGEVAEVVADIVVNHEGQSTRKPYYDKKRCFFIGPGKFDDITVDGFPSDLQLSITFEGNEPLLEHPIDYSAKGSEDASSRVVQMKSKNDMAWLIENQTTTSGINAKVFTRDAASGEETEIAYVSLQPRKAEQTPKKPKMERKPKQPEMDAAEKRPAGSVMEVKADDAVELDAAKKKKPDTAVSKTRHFPGFGAENGKKDIGATRHIGMLHSAVDPAKSLTRTHRFIPMPVDEDESFAGYFGNEGDWISGEKDDAKIKISWDSKKMVLEALTDRLTWNGRPWAPSDVRRLSDPVGQFEIKCLDDSFTLQFNSDVRPRLTLPNGKKIHYHWARLDTSPDLTLQLRPDMPQTYIGRGELCTINTSLDDFIDRQIATLEKRVRHNAERMEELRILREHSQRAKVAMRKSSAEYDSQLDIMAKRDAKLAEEIEKLQQLKKSFEFASIMSSRYHAVFNHELDIVANLSDIPVFVFARNDAGDLVQKTEIPGLPKTRWCPNCIDIMEELTKVSVENRKQFARERIMGPEGFVGCAVCNDKRKEAEFLPGECLVVGNAMYRYEKEE